MYLKLWLACAIVCGSVASTYATTTITVGDHSLLPNTPGQVIGILIADDRQGVPPAFLPPGKIAGIDLVLYMGGGIAGPINTNVDLIGPGTLFHDHNTGQRDLGYPFQAPGRELMEITSADNIDVGISANGILAFVTLDTTGIPLGSYTLSLSSEELGPTDAGSSYDTVSPYYPTLFSGTISVVPEPASIVLGLIGAAALGAVVIRKRRARFDSSSIAW